MIFIDTNVFVYAVGRGHPLREVAQSFFEKAVEEGPALVTSAEVLQELLHVYLPASRVATLDAALTLATSVVSTVWPVEQEDVTLARSLVGSYPGLGARDLIHLACCRRRGVTRIETFDRALAAAFGV